MSRLKDVLLVVLLVVVSSIPRMAGLGRFTSVDEPFWLRQSANFYYALGQRQFENTIYEYHPAVTTMWIVTAGLLVYFPEYRALGQGYLKPGKFDLFLPEHGKDPLQLLTVSRAIQVAGVVILMLVACFLIWRLLDKRAAFFSAALISISPFFLGHSRLLNHEALLGLFVLISMLGLLVYLYTDRRLSVLIVSAVSAALAQLTKSSGIVLFPMVILCLLVSVLQSRHRKWRQNAWAATKTFGLWVAALAVSYVLFWPGMWVAPGTMLSDVYGNALSYAFQGARLSVLPGLEPTGFPLEGVGAGLKVYLSDLAWRSSPVTWVGLVVGLVVAVAYFRRHSDQTYRLIAAYAIILAAAFVLLFAVQQGPKPPHYILTSFIALDLLAGIGISRGLDFLGRRWPGLARPWINWSVLGMVIAIQFASSVGFYPYYITYYNPLLEALQPGIQNPVLDGTGYGAGLDQAAAYLSHKSGADQITVMSANGYGCFSYYFLGHTVPMNNLVLSDPQIVSILRGSKYAVVDYYNQQRNGLAADLQGIAPEKTIWMNGVDFLHIYRASDLLARVDGGTP